MPVFLKILQRYTPTRPSVISAPLPLPGLSTLLMPETNILRGFVMHDEALRTSVWEADKKEKNQTKGFVVVLMCTILGLCFTIVC